MEGYAHQKVKDQTTQNKKPKTVNNTARKACRHVGENVAQCYSEKLEGHEDQQWQTTACTSTTAELESLFNFSNQL